MAGPGVGGGWTDCSTCTSTERPGPVMGKKRRLSLPFPGGPPPLCSAALPLPQCVSLLIVAFPSPRRSHGFPEGLQSRRFLSSTLCDNRPDRSVRWGAGTGIRLSSPLVCTTHHCTHYLHYSPFPVWVYVGGGSLCFGPCSQALRRGPDMGGPQVRYGWKGWGQGRVFESRVSNWTQC